MSPMYLVSSAEGKLYSAFPSILQQRQRLKQIELRNNGYLKRISPSIFENSLVAAACVFHFNYNSICAKMVDRSVDSNVFQ